MLNKSGKEGRREGSQQMPHPLLVITAGFLGAGGGNHSTEDQRRLQRAGGIRACHEGGLENRVHGHSP